MMMNFHKGKNALNVEAHKQKHTETVVIFVIFVVLFGIPDKMMIWGGERMTIDFLFGLSIGLLTGIIADGICDLIKFWHRRKYGGETIE